jgi:hypothetical protein
MHSMHIDCLRLPRGHSLPRHATKRDALPLLTPSTDDRPNLLMLTCYCCCAAEPDALGSDFDSAAGVGWWRWSRTAPDHTDAEFRLGERMTGAAFRGVTTVFCSGSSNFDRRRAFMRSSPTGQRMSMRHRPSTPREAHQPYPSPKPTERQRNITCGHAACWGGWMCTQTLNGALDHGAETPPSTDPSIDGGLLCVSPLGVPSGHFEGGSEGVLPPLRLEPSSFPRFSCVSLLSSDAHLHVHRYRSAPEPSRRGRHRVCMDGRDVWGVREHAAHARGACWRARGLSRPDPRKCCEQAREAVLARR